MKHAKKMVTLLAMVSMYCGSAYAVNGIAVSAHAYLAGRVGSTWTNEGLWGDIVRYDVRDNVVVSKKTIYKGTAHWATINMDGTHVAFFTTVGSIKYVSMVPIDGGDVVHLAQITQGNNNGNMSWPAGPWIYYNLGVDDAANSATIYRVNCNPPHTNELVGTLTHTGVIRCWEMDGMAKRVIVQDKDFPNLRVFDFPSGTAGENEVGTCNSKISVCGNIVTGFTNSGHTVDNFATWEGVSMPGVSNEDMSTWAGQNVSSGMDRPTWSCNSNYWSCVRIGWPGGTAGFDRLGGRFGKNGTNMVVYDYKNKIAIPISKDPQPATATDTIWSSESGDFWVDPSSQDSAFLSSHFVQSSTQQSLRIYRQQNRAQFQMGLFTNDIMPMSQARRIDLSGRTMMFNSQQSHRTSPQNMYILKMGENR